LTGYKYVDDQAIFYFSRQTEIQPGTLYTNIRHTSKLSLNDVNDEYEQPILCAKNKNRGGKKFGLFAAIGIFSGAR